MELLLNLLWLILALLTGLICSRAPKKAGQIGRSQVFVLAACLLALLFPIVSASDDLHALSAEIEESSARKSSVTQWSGSGCPAWSCDVSIAKQPVQGATVRPQNESIGLVSESHSVFAEQDLARSIGCRAPPAS